MEDQQRAQEQQQQRETEGEGIAAVGLRRRLNATGAGAGREGRGDRGEEQQHQRWQPQQQGEEEEPKPPPPSTKEQQEQQERAVDGAGALGPRIEEEVQEGEHQHEEGDGCCSKASGGGGGGGGGGGMGHRRITTEGDVDVAEDDTCCFDWGLLVEPVTLLCGHTFCRHCVGIMLDDAAAKGRGTSGAMKCPLCCRALPAILPQPNVRLRNELRHKYPALYQLRLDTVAKEFEAKQQRQLAENGGKRPRGHMTPEELQALLAGHHHRRNNGGAGGAAGGNGRIGGRGRGGEGGGLRLRFWQRQPPQGGGGDNGAGPQQQAGGAAEGGGGGGGNQQEEEEEEMMAADPVYDAVELFQTELLHIWRSRRWLSWLLALTVLLIGFAPVRVVPLPAKAAHVEGILQVDSWAEWWTLPRCMDGDASASPFCRLLFPKAHHSSSMMMDTDDDDHVSHSPSSSSRRQGSTQAHHLSSSPPLLHGASTDAFPGSELLATVYLYPSWGWVERVSRGIEGMLLDGYRLLHSPTPATLLSAFPGFAMAAHALCHQHWTLPFREIVAFLAIEGEIRQLMALWTVLTIPTCVPRDPRDIPPLPEMPAYAWTVLSLTLAQGAYLLACEMVAALLDIVALAPMLLALTKGQYWRNEASLIATALVRFWLMLREDWGLFRRILGRRSHMEATLLRLFILVAVFSAPLWAARPLYNSTDLVSTLASAGDDIVNELFDEVSKATGITH